jgi:hypothetical protein
MSHTSTLPNHEGISKFLRKHQLPYYYSKPVVRHIETFIMSATAKGYRGKVVDMAEWSSRHRTSIGKFLSQGVWDESYLQSVIKEEAIQFTVCRSKQTEKPIFVIHDDTVSEKTKPSSQAQRPIQQAGFHYSNLKGKTVWGHQMQTTMIQCDSHSLVVDTHRVDSAQKSKIDSACEMASQMPTPPYRGYALVDSWYTCVKLINAYQQRGYELIGGLKTNRILYPQDVRTPLDVLATKLTKDDVHLVTVNGSEYWVHRYEGALNDIEKAVVLLCWPQDAFQKPEALRAFLCTDVSLQTESILQFYSKRWPIEIFFRQTKGNLGLDQYQIRSDRAIDRFLILLTFVHLYCTLGLGYPSPFGEGLRETRKQINIHYIQWVYECGKNHVPFHDVLKRLKLESGELYSS